MNSRVIAVLAVVLAVLAVVVIVTQQASSPSTVPTSGPASPTATLLLDNVKPIDQVELKQASTTVRFHKESDRWQLDQPASSQPDQARMTSIVAKLQGLRPIGTYPPSDLATFGLAIPDFQITIRYEGGATKTLLVGNQSPVKTGYYAKLEGLDSVFLLDSVFTTEAKGLITGPPIVPPTATPTIVGPVLPSPAASSTPPLSVTPAPSATP